MKFKRLKKQGIPIASFLVLGLSGVGIHILIGRLYDVQVLGQFNSALAFYLVFAQVASLGNYMAVMHFFSVPLDSLDPQEAWLILCTVAGISILGSVGIIVLSFVLYGIFPSIFGTNTDTARMILASTLGIPFFCINKNILAFLNAQNHINSYFSLQGLRYLLLLAVLLGMAMAGFSPVWLCHVFWICEGVLLLIAASIAFRLTRAYFSIVWATRVIAFSRNESKIISHSLKGLPGDMVQELAVRVDIFMLMYLVEPFQVGIYSVAAMVAEGLNQVTGLVRDQLSPEIGRLYFEQKKQVLGQLVRKTIVSGYLLLFVPGLLAVVLFPDIVEWLFANPDLQLAGLPFGILMAGLYLSSPYHFLFYAPNQMGRPIVLTWIVTLSTLFNLLLNLLLIPFMGIEGAATATVLSWILALFLLGVWLNKNLS
jgi:O-antigen/teichoic acid export membrane protein